ncbi:HAD family hydrolase [Streptomyces sp. NRRL F-5053]|uniref:HAD family hydrolase n=1 Tax=Streptomyces sp. NRRL F-5053 TaxID=1463854 RepID=UPI0004C96E7D|nr:haloacid dehalogenase-like hydrolase [Streptomyces sp. NRRL F-5053]
MRPLLLWDIDHTLIETRGMGRLLSAAAFARVTGRPMQQQAAVDGSTEAVIFRETARLHGMDTTRRDFERFALALADEHVRRAAELRQRGATLPGAAAALAALGSAGVRQTVVTGNVRAVAETKLGVFGLGARIDWHIGAYGEDADRRSDLVALALARAGSVGGEAVLVGDTRADVEAGRANGVRVIAVATGRSPVPDLREVGADIVLDDLTDTGRLLELVRASGPPA